LKLDAYFEATYIIPLLSFEIESPIVGSAIDRQASFEIRAQNVHLILSTALKKLHITVLYDML